MDGQEEGPPPGCAVVPNLVHFVFGLREQDEPFHLLHYLALESCRRVVGPERILFHYHHLPWGVYWDLIRPHLTLVPVDLAPEVLAADYAGGRVPEEYRYAHHADFVRLDALIHHGGLYADIDSLFVRPLAPELYRERFVIGSEGLVHHEASGTRKPSMCNALMLAEPGAEFAMTWRRRMEGALDGSWSGHSGFLAHRLSEEIPHEVRVEPVVSFFPLSFDAAGLAALLEHDVDLPGVTWLHLWAHLWWSRDRRDFSDVHAGMFSADHIRSVDTTYNRLARPFLPELDLW